MILTYSPDRTLIMPAVAVYIADGGLIKLRKGVSLMFDGETNVTKNGVKSLCLVINPEQWMRDAFAVTNVIEILAEGPDPIGDVLANGGTALTKYRSVWPETFTYKDEDGVTQTATNPDRFASCSVDLNYRDEQARIAYEIANPIEKIV